MSQSKICRDIDRLHPHVKDMALKVLEDCEAQGLNVDIFETLRTEERQKWLKSNGKSKTMNSYHRLGLAVDFVFKTKNGNWTWRVAEEKWDRLAEIMESHGFYSLWKRAGWDGPHGELRFKGVRTSTLYKELRESGDLTPFWFDHIDPRLPEDAQTTLSLFAERPSPNEDLDQLLDDPVVPVEYETPPPVPAPQPPQGFISVLINFIMGLFRR